MPGPYFCHIYLCAGLFYSSWLHVQKAGFVAVSEDLLQIDSMRNVSLIQHVCLDHFNWPRNHWLHHSAGSGRGLGRGMLPLFTSERGAVKSGCPGKLLCTRGWHQCLFQGRLGWNYWPECLCVDSPHGVAFLPAWLQSRCDVLHISSGSRNEHPPTHKAQASWPLLTGSEGT